MEILGIDEFLRPVRKLNYNKYGGGDEDGYGYGYGKSDGDGDGGGNGYGSGYAVGDGYGDGNGEERRNVYGYGDGSGIKNFNKQKVYLIDSVPTIIAIIKQDIAKGFIIKQDYTLEPCYIVRNDYHYSHGKTLKEALKSLEEKTLLCLPIEQRILNFKSKFKDYSKKVKATILYEEHFKLTGSCKTGRNIFINDNQINLAKDKFTINEFIKLTENSYGSEIIKQLKNN